MRRLTAASRRMQEDETGFALVSVIGLTAIMTLIAGVALTYALNNQAPSRNHQDWNAALAAAEAGLDDYLSRLNRDTSYWASATPDNPLGNDALDPDAWAQLPDSEAQFTYTVDASAAASQGLIMIQSTGRVRGQTRTIEATLRPAGFLEYVYFTDLELLDPDINPTCSHDYYFDNTSRGSSCWNIVFATSDVIDGPLRSNDRILIQGSPTFQGRVYTWWRPPGNPSGPYYNTSGSGPHNPQFWEGIEVSTQLPMPQTNASIRQQTSSTAGGCNYYGPTYIRFLDNGTFRVRSPLSVDPPDGQPLPNANCFQGDVSSLASPQGAVVSMDDPFNGVIYVSSTDPSKCTSNPLGLPTPGEAHSPIEYLCHEGDAFVWGTVKGQATVAAERDIKVIWDLVYADDVNGSDLLGLIADQYIKVWHPVSQWRAYTLGGSSAGNNLPNTAAGLPPYPPGDEPHSDPRTWQDPEIHAAILSLNKTFTVQNFNIGQRFMPANGSLTVKGAIAQKYRGPVGIVNTTGYAKDYQFDWRLRHLSPPYFLTPEDAQWVQRAWAELRTPDDLPPFD